MRLDGGGVWGEEKRGLLLGDNIISRMRLDVRSECMSTLAAPFVFVLILIFD